MEGFDPTKTGAQYVTIYTEPIEGYNILTNFDNMLRAFSDNKITFEGYCISGWIDINARLAPKQNPYPQPLLRRWTNTAAAKRRSLP